MVVFFATLLPARTSKADGIPLDKQAHVAVSYGLTLTGALLLEKTGMERWLATLIAFSGTMLIGVTKEAFDDEFSGTDQVANLVGASTAAGMVLVFKF